MLTHLENTRSNSFANKSSICGTLANFCKSTGKNPDELVKLKRKAIELLIRNFGNARLAKTNWARTANLEKRRLNTFFQQNGFNNRNGKGLFLDISYQAPRSFKVKQYIPTPEEAVRMADSYGRGTRNRALVLFIAFSGFRNSTARAVLIKDVKEEIEKGFENVMVHVYPEMKEMVPTAAKNNIPYYVFTPKLLTDALREYLERRKEQYGEIPDPAPLFNSEQSARSRGNRNLIPISAREVQLIVKKAAKAAGLPQWQFVTPHSLRKTFQVFLRNQMPDVKPDLKEEEFDMGHVLAGAQDTYFDKSKEEEMRAKYSRFVVFEDPVLKRLKSLAEECKLDPVLLREKQKESLGRIPTHSEEIQLLEKAIAERKNRPTKLIQRIVEEAELQVFLDADWKIQVVLPSGKIVVTRETDEASLIQM